jgi:hypothetical protein
VISVVGFTGKRAYVNHGPGEGACQSPSHTGSHPDDVRALLEAMRAPIFVEPRRIEVADIPELLEDVLDGRINP